MSPATIDRRLQGAKVLAGLRGQSHTKPGSLLKSQIPIRTWSEWDEGVPGFCEIDLVGHEGGNSFGEFCFTLTMTDVASGWTVNRSVPNKAAVWVTQAIDHAATCFPFPVLGIDSDNGSEFINAHLFDYCTERKITFTRSRPGNKNDGAHVEQKNWTHVRELVGYLRFDTAAELNLLNRIWELDRGFTNLVLTQQKLVSRTRVGRQGHQTPRSGQPPLTNGPSTPGCSPRPSGGPSPGAATPCTPASSNERSPGCATSSNGWPWPKRRSPTAPSTAPSRTLARRRFYVRQRLRAPGGFDVRQ